MSDRPSPLPRPLRFRSVLLVVVASVALLHTAANREWVDTEVFGPFECRADFDLREVRGLLRSLTELQRDLQELLGIQPTDEPIEILLFRDRSAYQRYVSLRIPEGAQRPALFVKGGGNPGRVYAYRSRDLAVNLRHETTHALLHSALPFVPLWLDEGLAEYFEVPAAERLHDNPHMRSTKLAVRFKGRPRLEDVEGRRNMSEMGGKEYRESWAWVHFMLHGPPEARRTLLEYLANVQEGNPTSPLGSELRRRIPNLEYQYVEHFKRWDRR